MTGIELLQMVKDNELEDRTLIRTTGPFPQYYLFRKNGEHPNFGKCDDEGKVGGMYGQYKFMTTKALFRDYEIVGVIKETPSNIEKIEMVGCEVECKSLDASFGIDTPMVMEITVNKINELIDAVNYLLDTQNKG